MKCLVIHGSPRRGNTYDVLSLVLGEFESIENLEIEIVELGKKKIPFCIGCFNCIKNGEEKCPHRNVMEEIIDKVDKADVLIFTSPIYSMQISGLLKNFIDHMSYNFHRPRFIGKKALVITTTAGAGHKAGAKYVKSVLEYWGITNIKTIPIAYRDNELNEANKTYILKKAREFKSIIEVDKVKNASLKQVMMYNLWNGMDKGDELIKDKEFYEENNRIYYDENRVSGINKIIGKLFYKIIKNRG